MYMYNTYIHLCIYISIHTYVYTRIDEALVAVTHAAQRLRGRERKGKRGVAGVGRGGERVCVQAALVALARLSVPEV
jgi:hypothetical protein